MTLEAVEAPAGASQHSDEVPPEIRSAYTIEDTATVQPITHGLVNRTYQVTETFRRTVLQRLSGVIHPESTRDAAAVSDHLASKGWDSPQLLPTNDGALSIHDDAGLLWRRQHYISSDKHSPELLDDTLLIGAVEMLGKWHRDVADLDYLPRYGIPHFHDTAHYAGQLDEVRTQLPDHRTRTLASQALQAYEGLATDIEDDQQVIHGDPKLDNILFRDGKPFTLIDYDTLMFGSPWIDVGDMLRSAVGKQLGVRKIPTTALVEQFSSAYRHGAGLKESEEQSYNNTLRATSRVAIELAMRYLLDIHDQDYFSWDTDRFESRRDNHVPRAELQLNIAKLTLNFANNS